MRLAIISIIISVIFSVIRISVASDSSQSLIVNHKQDREISSIR